MWQGRSRGYGWRPEGCERRPDPWRRYRPQRALYAPVRQIAANAGHDGAVISGKLLDGADHDVGFNAQTDTYENLVTVGVIDPTKVVRTALQDAASVAGLLITTDAAVSELPADDKAPAGMPGGGMGGMDF